MDWIREKWAAFVALLANHWLFLSAVAVILVAVFVIRPFEREPDPVGDDIAVAWNESISRLGITPVYPPTEDLSVGDVWAFVAEVDDGDQKVQPISQPLLGKAVRIGQIDLRQLVLASAKHPVFADTVDPVDKGKVWKQDRWEMPPPDPATNGRIGLSLTAFPGVTIEHKSQIGAQAGANSGWFGARRQREQREQIAIKAAETYGIATNAGLRSLQTWCDKNKELCEDSFARRLLSYSIGEQVLEAKGAPKKYTYRLGLQVVTRVFIMRQIEHRRSNDVARGAIAQGGEVKVETPSAPAGTPQSTATISAISANLTPNATGGAQVGRLSSDGLTLSLDETFQRPVAFGYRAVTVSLKPSTPENKP